MRVIGHCKISGFAPEHPDHMKPRDMKSPLPAVACLCLCCPGAGQRRQAPPPSPTRPRGRPSRPQVCGACHAVDGSRGMPANPILQGQHPEYLVKQLHDFKSGKRNNAIMKGFATTLSDEDMRNVAAFYASQDAPSRASPRTRTLVLLGEKIYRGGIADRRIAGLRRLPQPQRRRHSGAVPARRRPAWRLLRGAADRLPLRRCAPTACRWPASPPS